MVKALYFFFSEGDDFRSSTLPLAQMLVLLFWGNQLKVQPAGKKKTADLSIGLKKMSILENEMFNFGRYWIEELRRSEIFSPKNGTAVSLS